MIDDHHKRHALRRRMHSAWTLPTEPAPWHASLQPIEPEPWQRAAPARPVPVSRPWWRRVWDALRDLWSR